jgi:mRNA-degrading endonuclease toxin of MazEF toxin-antitoxin module
MPTGPAKGDVYADLYFRDIGGHVLSGPHFAIVVQTARMASSATCLVIPVTSRAASAHLSPPYLVALTGKELGLAWDGFAHADQVFTFPSSELQRRIGRIPLARQEDVDAALRFVLAL